ncbi:MAG TPA: tubulin-like doman-containing protein [Fimbriiglobus sp.]|nr:tubulin-like doman-containing protein [Fimbriiglobus sp.]
MPVRLVSQEELPDPLRGYKLNKRIGRGGFGEVWEVEAPGGLLKAAKFVFGDLNSTEAEEGRPAEQEQKALNRVKAIRHPYILSLERFDVIDGQLIIVMELADRNLWDRFRECRAQGHPGIPRDELLNYMEEAAEALDLMNNHHQIQHLDIKPQNIFLVHNHVKVADFGLAKLMEKAEESVTGGITPVYAAPETFGGRVSRFCDQYSLGIVYQEMLSGTRPFNGSNTKQLLLQHLNAPPELNSLPESDRWIVGRALSKEPNDRWPTCADMVRALRRADDAPATVADLGRAKPDTPLPGAGGSRRAATPKLGSGVIQYPSPVGSGGVATTSRPLVTPRLVTPQAASGGNTPAHTLQRAQVFQTGRMSTLGIAPPEKTGDGVLFPALVVAVGATGLAVLKKLRQLVRDRFGNPELVPTLRCLYLDTDPDAVAAATQGPDALSGREVILARLNRPAHYLQDNPLPNVEAWLPPGLLYRLPKNPGPANGVRAFGRLAFCDNYRTIAQRIRQEIETFLTDDPLDRAAEATGLGVRTNRMRAYVLAGLGGGTGSGMAVDLAYVLKHELRGVGYRKPEAVGVLLLPPADKSAAKSLALANTCAALTEVHHFASGNRYQTRFDANEAPVLDTEGPFARCAVVPLPRAPKERDQSRSYGLAARVLYLELLTPAGRVADDARAVYVADPGRGAALAQPFGLYRLTWPRVELVAAAARRFNQRLLQRWAGKEAGHLKEPIGTWLAEQWSKLQLDPTAVVARFDRVVRDQLREEPEAAFDAIVDGLRTRTPGSSRTAAAAACAVLDQLLKLVGKPDAEREAPGSLEVAVQEREKKLVAEIERSLAAMAVAFIEQPQYRLAGAEEAFTQICDLLRTTVAELEKNRRVLNREVRELYLRLFHLIGGLGSSSGLGALNMFKAAIPGELIDGLRTYPVRRMRLAQLDAALSAYRTLLANIPEYIRDVNYCRTRLGEMSQALGAQAAADVGIGPGRMVLPEGCQTLDDAADQFLGSLPPEDILSFDQKFQKDLAAKFRGLANVCLTKDKVDDFLDLLTGMARAFIDERMERTDPATMILRWRGDGAEASKLLAEAYAGAAPALSVETAAADTVVLAAPVGEAGDRLRQLAAEACPGVAFVPAPLADDVLIYREQPLAELSELPQMIDVAREAYDSQIASEQTPHSRIDLAWTVPGTG